MSLQPQTDEELYQPLHPLACQPELDSPEFGNVIASRFCLLGSEEREDASMATIGPSEDR